MAMRLELVGKEVIKPASPTPDHLRTLQLSLLDHFIPPLYIPAIFFYNAEANSISEEIISQRLKNSLSETLTRFYPLAGRVEGVHIDCNDEGVVFTKARSDFVLSDFLKNIDLALLGQFLPTIASDESSRTWPLLQVKVCFFKCGGVVIAVCASHKICDITSLAIFVRDWAATTKGIAHGVIPEFSWSTLYPLLDLPLPSLSLDGLTRIRNTTVAKRFVFESSKIGELRSKAASESVPNPTRVEVVSSLIWKCATKATRSNLGTSRPSVMAQIMDLRLRIPSPHLLENAMGNHLSSFMLKKGQEGEAELGETVAEFRSAKEEMGAMIKETFQGDNSRSKLSLNLMGIFMNMTSELNLEMEICPFTSWCKKPFYEVDFGWGNPTWFAPGQMHRDSFLTILTDTKDGKGIEAWISLKEQDMKMFERDQELLAFATINPSVPI